MSGVEAPLNGLVAVVTGGGSSPGRVPSVGEASARLLARQGAAVAVVDIDPDCAAGAVQAIEAEGGRAIAVVGDLSQEQACRRAVEETIAHLGRLDILVNNVGIGDGQVLHEVREEDFDRTMAVNLKSAVFMSKYAVPLMTEGGAVVNLSTLAVDKPATSLAYSTSKMALEGLTRHIAFQYGPQGVRCNAVRPGELWTAMVDRHRKTQEEAEEAQRGIRSRTALLANGDAWDAAQAVAFLAGPYSRWITGQVLLLDGGASLLRPDPDWVGGRAYWKASR